MNVLIINGSPKKRFSASACFSKLLKIFLLGNNINTVNVCNKNDFKGALPLLKTCDILVISSPLYVDGVPSHMLEFLVQAETFCKAYNCKCKCYALSNSGFIEGIGNKVHLDIYKCWCERANIVWGGGIGIGGGVMLHIILIIIPIQIIIYAAQIIIYLLNKNFLSIINTGLSFFITMLIMFFLSCGVIFCLWMLSISIRGKKTYENRYTRVMIPAFLFIIFADIFMVISALFKGEFILLFNNKNR